MQDHNSNMISRLMYLITSLQKSSNIIMNMDYIYQYIVYIVIIFLLIRILQRIYYLFLTTSGSHFQYITYSPKVELEKFISLMNIPTTDHVCYSINNESDPQKISLKYRRLGNGKQYILLANGVGTDFYMWLPMLRFLILYDPLFFTKYTLIVPSYRGLFHIDDKEFGINLEISIKNCIDDIRVIMKHAHIIKYHAIIGWSTGAQVALACCSKYPNLTTTLFLLNPSLGLTLHYALQPIIPLPTFLRKFISWLLTIGINQLKPLITTAVWDALKLLANSVVIRIFLESLAFFSGFPPDQPVYFHDYLRDVFRTRLHTRSLLDLILSLDEPKYPDSTSLEQSTMILSGYPDFITGVYHSNQLAKELRGKVYHICFSMGSHFLLIEWPDLVAEYLVDFLTENKE